MALHWIRGEGEYKQFVSNHVKKIQAKSSIQWRHIRLEENPADVASRGGQMKQSWWRGPDWLSHPENCTEDIITHPMDDTEVEAKLVKEVLGVSVEEDTSSGKPYELLHGKLDSCGTFEQRKLIRRTHSCPKKPKCRLSSGLK